MKKHLLFLLKTIFLLVFSINFFGLKKSDSAIVVDCEESFLNSRNINNGSIYLKDKYSAMYFYNLHENSAHNFGSTCGFVTLSMLLSYWDTYWDDSIVPEQYDVSSNLIDNLFSFENESPGIRNESLLLNQSPAFNYLELVNNYKNSYLQLKLIDVANECLSSYSFSESDIPGIGPLDYQNILESYLSEYLNFGQGDYHIISEYRDASNGYSSSYIKQRAVDFVKQGIPVKIGLRTAGNTAAHSVVAYDYDETTGNLYCHFGWGPYSTHMRPEDSGGLRVYDSLTALVFDNNHRHSNNYVNDVDESVCSCFGTKPFEVKVNENFVNGFPKIEWNSFVNEKWNIDNGDEIGKYKISILLNNQSYLFFERETHINNYSFSQLETRTITKWLNYTIRIAPFLETRELQSNFIYQGTILSPTEYSQAENIRAADLNFYDSGSGTSEAFVSHQTEGGLIFQTKRQRVFGYQVLNCIKMKPSKFNQYSYLEFSFAEPILGLEIQMALENQESASSLNALRIEILNENGDWDNYHDFLTNVQFFPNQLDRSSWFSVSFDKKITNFRIVCLSGLGIRNGPSPIVCISNFSFWMKNPISGYELPLNDGWWNSNSRMNTFVSSYGYALNSIFYPNTNQVWENQKPGNYYSRELQPPYTEFRLLNAINNDLDQYFEDFGIALFFETADRFEICPRSRYKVAIFASVEDGVETGCRFYRQNDDGFWSFKNDNGDVSDKDDSAEDIVDPLISNRGIYTKLIGYYSVTPWSLLR